MTARSRQLSFLKNEPNAYGGVLRNTRAGRQGERPLAVRKTIHLVLRSSKAKGEMSFRRKANAVRIQQIVKKHSLKNGVKILMMANVGNHLHLHIKLGNRFRYAPFIRAITGAIALAVTRVSEVSKNQNQKQFWDYRPFTRIVEGLRDFFSIRDYIRINELEGVGIRRDHAKLLVKKYNYDISLINMVPG